MKIITWNINGIRACVRKGFADFLAHEKPDIICLQEIKIDEKAIAKEKIKYFDKKSVKSGVSGDNQWSDFDGYDEYWNSAQRPGYSGTATLIRVGTGHCPVLINSTNGLGIQEFDIEGRLQTLEFDKFYLLNIYFPNSNGELSRLGYKEKFNEAFLKYAKKLEKKKPVIATGDFNVAHQEIDLKNPKPNIGNAGFTDEEREWMDKFIKAGFVDVFRKKYPEKVQYSWWSYRFNARARNIGWRIDYFLASAKLMKYIDDIIIMDKVLGSDHAPIKLLITND